MEVVGVAGTASLNPPMAKSLGKRRAASSYRAPALTDCDAEWFRMACNERWWVTAAASSGGNSSLTHASLDGVRGGKLSVPDDRRADFYAALARDVREKKAFFLNELHTNPSGLMRLFFDLDLKGPTVKGDSFAIEFAQIAQQVVRQFFPSLPPGRTNCLDVAIVSRSPDSFNGANGVQLRTEGYHIYFPNMVQFRKDVLTIFYQLRQSCKLRLPRAPLENGWDKVLDDNVYDRTGLRLYGSCTIKSCPECQRRGDVVSDCACGGSFQVNGRHRYENVVAYLRGADGNSDPERERQLRQNPHDVLLTCCVQVSQTFTQPSPLGFSADQTNPGVQLSLAQASNKSAPKTKTGWETVRSPGILSIVAELVQNFARVYEKLTVVAVHKEKVHQTKYEVLVEGEGEHYCFNKVRVENSREVAGDHHRSRSIYFEIFTNRIVQRCRCTCKPDPAAGVRRATGQPCSNNQVDIKSVLLSVPQTKSLFPNFQCDQLSFMYGLFLSTCPSSERLQKIATWTRYSALKGWPSASDSSHSGALVVRPPRNTVVDY